MCSYLTFSVYILLNIFIGSYGKDVIGPYIRLENNTDSTSKYDTPQRIVGGNNAGTISLYPYQVSFRVKGKHACGGSIIGPKHILTATHCKYMGQSEEWTPDIVRVVSGTANLRNGGELHEISKIISYPGFLKGINNFPALHDITIVVLKYPMQFNQYQMPIRLPSRDIHDGDIGTVTGWGIADVSLSYEPYWLQVIQMKILSNTECRKSMYPVFDQTFCAFRQRGMGLCYGDSGGPLVVNNEIVGIVSWGKMCAAGYPDVFTNVYKYKSFIYYVMGQT